MKLFEDKEDIIVINIDLNLLKEINKEKMKRDLQKDIENYNEFIVERIRKGNLDLIIKAIKEIRDKLIKSGCSNYDEYYRKYLK